MYLYLSIGAFAIFFLNGRKLGGCPSLNGAGPRGDCVEPRPQDQISCRPSECTKLTPIMTRMSDFREMARQPAHRRQFEKLLLLACQRGDADLVAERLAWGIDPNCTFVRGKSPLIANVRGSCPSAATVETLLKAGADPGLMDEAGLTPLDYARRKLLHLQARPGRKRKPPSLDENDQLRLGPEEQAELAKMRDELGADDCRDFFRTYWQERRRAARRVFNDPVEVEKIIDLLMAASER